ncbi:MAG: histidine kinase [Gemmatimonadales bacterium]|jgi:signal transduction histidine kinase
MSANVTAEAARPPLRLVTAWLTAFWVFLWIVDSNKDWVAVRLTGRNPSLLHNLVVQIPWWGAWWLLAPLVAYLAWRFPLTGPCWKIRLLWHVVAGIAVATLQVVISATLFEWRDRTVSLAGVYDRSVDYFNEYVMFGFIAYLGMIGFVAAWTYYRGMRDREREAVRLALRTSKLERAMTEARLEALRRQLHPHFLFNSLNTVAGLARRGETERVTNMLERLGDLLRLRLDDEQPDEITLERELEWMAHYFAIERERFGDRLDVRVTVPRSLQQALVPAMLLQPLVENAVRHGIGSEEERGSVEVSARRDGDRLVITVSDSGPGFGTTWSSGGIGLANTRERLAQLYGDDGVLATGNGAQTGGRVTVEIPWHTERDRKADS